MQIANDALDTDRIESKLAAENPADPQIKALAHRYWEERTRNGETGSAEEDWHRAERDLSFANFKYIETEEK